MKRSLSAFFLVLLLAVGTAFAEGDAAKAVKIIIDVKDMDCSLCVTSINQALRKTQGVVKAKASLKTKQVEVVVPKDFPSRKLLDAISKTGYTGKIAKIEENP